MPRGMNPNSLKALEEHGKKTQFKQGEKKARSSVEKSVATQAKDRTFRDELRKGLREEIEVNGKNGVEKKTVREIGTRAILKKYMNGDPRVYELVRDTIGEKPVDVVMISEIDADVMNEVEGLVGSL